MSSGGDLTLPDNVADKLRQSRAQPRSAGHTAEQAEEQLAQASLSRRNIHEVQETEFDNALAANAYEYAGTARQLNVSRQSVYRRIDESSRHRLPGEIPMWEVREALAAQGGDCAAAALQLRVSAASLRARLRAAGIDFR